MPFVLDASVTACWAFEDENEAAAEDALDRLSFDDALVPALWWFEIRNALIVSERRQKKTAAQTKSFLDVLARMPIVVDPSPDGPGLLDLARKHGLTVYDAAYLELAMRRREPLATLDRKLAAAARAESIALIGAP
jgi:predicted nucleic acid-binding protein